MNNRNPPESAAPPAAAIPFAQPPIPNHFLDHAQFQNELKKEVYRSQRRATGREFGLIQMIFPDGSPQALFSNSKFVTALQKRLRFTDSIGFHDNNLAFLLPETHKDGTLLVANDLAKIALQQGLHVDTEVSIYPWNDELTGLSTQFEEVPDHGNNQADSEPDTSHHENPVHEVSDFDSSDFDSSDQNTDDFETASTPQEHDQNAPTAALCDELSVSQRNMHFVTAPPTPLSKRLFDIVGSLVGLVLLSPLLLFTAVAIKATSTGPIFFLQQREGKNGKPFWILKFRTMVAGAEQHQIILRPGSEQDGPAFKLEHDPRITRVGRFLRKSCADELPQLINVLLGQMSLVGPRPLPVRESHACLPWQRRRLIVLPGLTCIWQTRGGRNVKFEQWMRMDLEYIRKRSFLFDLRLIGETAVIALLHRGSV
jgi:lipopolysaccharide/colanic/teichoic acid biosynthesis glycosyltransferase